MAGCLNGGAGDAAVGAYAVAVADALPKHWGGGGGGGGSGARGGGGRAAATTTAGPDAALASKAAALASLASALVAGDALTALAPAVLRTLAEAGERVAAVAAVRAAVNEARAPPTGGRGRRPHPAVDALIASAGAAALPAATRIPPEDAFYGAPVKAAAALLAALPAAAAAAAGGARGPSPPPDRWAALAALAALTDTALEAARAHRTAWRAAHPAAAALALVGDGRCPDWLCDGPARAALGALCQAAASLLPAALADAPHLSPAAIDTTLTAADRLLDAHARASAAANQAVSRPGGRAASFTGGADPGEYEAAAASSLRPALDALPVLAGAAGAGACAAATARIEGLAAVHGAWGVLYAALRTDPSTGLPLPRGADRLYARMASAAAAVGDSDAAGPAASFAEHAFARLAAGPTPSELLELPAPLNTPLAAWLASRGPGDAAAARLRWLHDLRRRRYGDAAATLLGLALPGGGGGVVGVGAGEVPGPGPAARAAAAAKLAALASSDPWPGGGGAGVGAASPAMAAADAAAVLARAAAALTPGAASPPPAAELAELALTGVAAPAAAAAPRGARGGSGRGRRGGEAAPAPAATTPIQPDPLLALELVGAAAVLAAWAGRGGGGHKPPPPDLRRLLEASFARLAAGTDWAALSAQLASVPDDARRAALAATPLAAGAGAAFADPAAAALYAPLLPPEAGLACALDGAGLAGPEGSDGGANAARGAVHAAWELGLAGLAGAVERGQGMEAVVEEEGVEGGDPTPRRE